MTFKLREFLTIPMSSKSKIDLQVFTQSVDYTDGKQMAIYCSVFNGSIQDFAKHLEEKVFDQYLDNVVTRIGVVGKNVLQIAVKPLC